MKITLVDGSLKNYDKPNYTKTLCKELQQQGHEVNLIVLENKQINYCNGCWSCWWKTPGICPQKDDMHEIYKSYMKSDMVLHFSSLDMGFVSSKLKTINDRTIPLVHPYMTIVNGECHHKKRYDKYPYLGLIVDPKKDNNEDLEITRDLYSRMALNFKTELKLYTTIQKSTEDICNEISSI
ncbi:MAG: NAD(P)H-dependent oxidoreductase [Prolixibacteraceae bacterium]|jgi:multimeric flavodoxin WrbA|nr:NAD(P)H-dependent oxidoreductase [Prolixibacteraceae bacterium]